MEAYTKLITCPEHKTDFATLYLYPHKYAGVWECGDISDACEHEDSHIETVEVTHFTTPDLDTSYEELIYVCNACEVTLDGSPAIDKAEAKQELAWSYDD